MKKVKSGSFKTLMLTTLVPPLKRFLNLSTPSLKLVLNMEGFLKFQLSQKAEKLSQITRSKIKGARFCLG